MCVCVGDYVSLAIEPYNLGDYGNEINKYCLLSLLNNLLRSFTHILPFSNKQIYTNAKIFKQMARQKKP
jgi:hypothetical protein